MTFGKNPRSSRRLSRDWPFLVALAAGLWMSFATSELPAPPGGLQPSEQRAEAAFAAASQVTECEQQCCEADPSLSAARSVVDAAPIGTAALVRDPIDAAWFDWEFDASEQQSIRSSPLRRRSGTSPFHRGKMRR